MAGRPYVLAEATWEVIRDASIEVAVLPWGATEAHNYHLPYGTDTIQVEAVAVEAARIAHESGASVLVLPAIPLGVQSGQLDIPFCLHMNPSTQMAVLRDVARSVSRHKVGKLVILNGHGGNDFKAMIRELQPNLEVLLCTVNWYSCVDPADVFDVPGDHAGELETSVTMHLKPDLVLPLERAGAGLERGFRIAAFREGWAWAPRQWTSITEDTGVGDPKHASRAKGERFFDAVALKLGAFLGELSAADPDDLYETGNESGH